VNLRKKKLKKPLYTVTIDSREREESLKFNRSVVQDLTDVKLKGRGGYRYVSVCIDEDTRVVSLKPLRKKWSALTHCVEWVRRSEQRNRGKPKEWRSDNGGEFVNEEYEKFLTTEGILQTTSAPYTPETQGIVERCNATMKNHLKKFYIDHPYVPLQIWPSLLPGVEQLINNTVNSGIGMSPARAVVMNEALGDKFKGAPEFVLGDIVLIQSAVPKEGEELERSALEPSSRRAIYCGWVNSKKVRVNLLNLSCVFVLVERTGCSSS